VSIRECDCGNPVAAGSDVCAECFALELEQGLCSRRGNGAQPSGDYGARAEGETEADYQRRRRRARAADGWCSVCSVNRAEGVRPDGKPCRSCEPCRVKAKDDRDARMDRGLCRHCSEPAQAPTKLCAIHRKRLLDYVTARRKRSGGRRPGKKHVWRGRSNKKAEV
jgi:hypothetical protein